MVNWVPIVLHKNQSSYQSLSIKFESYTSRCVFIYVINKLKAVTQLYFQSCLQQHVLLTVFTY